MVLVGILHLCNNTLFLKCDVTLYLNGSKFVYPGGGKHERGVRVIISQKISKSFFGYWAISGRVIMMRIKGKPFDISVIQLYAPTADSNEEEIDLFYEQLDETKGNANRKAS